MQKLANEPLSDPDREHDATVIAQIVALVHARRQGDYLAAAEAHKELERLGMVVKFPRKRAETGRAR